MSSEDNFARPTLDVFNGFNGLFLPDTLTSINQDISHKTIQKQLDLNEFSYQPEILDSQRLLIGREIGKGKGSTGKVFRVYDIETGRIRCMKVLAPSEKAKTEMKRCNLTAPKQVEAEDAFFGGSDYLVPRLRDHVNGRDVIWMPEFRGDLEDIVGTDCERKSVKEKTLSKEAAFNIALQTGCGLGALHDEGITHCDPSFKNAVYDERGRIRWIDFADSRKSDALTTTTVNDNRGYRHTKAPECENKDSSPGMRPQKCSDVFGWGSMTLRMYSGQWADEITRGCKTNDEAEKALRKAVKKSVPRNLRPIIMDSLKYDFLKRTKNGGVLTERLKEIVENRNAWKALKKSVKRFVPLPLAIAAPLSFALYGISTYEPKETIPKPRINGEIYLSGNPKEAPVQFEMENVANLPKSTERMINSSVQNEIKSATNNRNVAALLSAYHDVMIKHGALSYNYCTDPQVEMYSLYTPTAEKQWTSRVDIRFKTIAKSIEVAMTKSVGSKGTVKLEKLCVIARVGQDKVDLAIESAGSLRFDDYITAKDNKGQYVIPVSEQRFIREWVSQAREYQSN